MDNEGQNLNNAEFSLNVDSQGRHVVITPTEKILIEDLLKCYEERNTPPKLMTVSQYARAKKINLAHKPVSTQAVYMWIKDRKLKTVKVGKITLIVV